MKEYEAMSSDNSGPEASDQFPLAERHWTPEQAFFARWSSWKSHLPGPSGIEVRALVLDEEPPRASLSCEGSPAVVSFVMGRGAMPAVYRVDEHQRLLSVRQASRLLDLPAPLVEGAQGAVLDGLEQAEAAAGRGPGDRAPAPAVPWRVVQGQQPGTAHPDAVRQLNEERIQRQASARIRSEELGSPARPAGARWSR